MKRSTVEVWDIAIDLMLCCGLPIPHPSFFFFLVISKRSYSFGLEPIS